MIGLSVMGPVETRSEMRLSMTGLSMTKSIGACRFKMPSFVRDKFSEMLDRFYR
jgi:hypothetical protein